MPPRKLKLSRIHEYIITAAEGAPELVGKKCRLVLSAEGQEVEIVAGYALDLQAYMLTGKQKLSVVDLPPVKLRYAHSDGNCRCPAYKFPHARGLGACKSERTEQIAPADLTIENLFTQRSS